MVLFCISPILCLAHIILHGSDIFAKTGEKSVSAAHDCSMNAHKDVLSVTRLEVVFF